MAAVAGFLARDRRGAGFALVVEQSESDWLLLLSEDDEYENSESEHDDTDEHRDDGRVGRAGAALLVVGAREGMVGR